MIFGAGDNQLTLIKAARDLEIKSIVIDPNINAPGKTFADVFEVVSPDDYKKTRNIAKKYKVDGIVTSQMENPLMLMARLAEEMGYIFPSSQVIRQCRNKYLMKQVFQKNRIPCAKGILIKQDEILPIDELNNFSFPLIIKPVDSHSSRGVYKVCDKTEIKYFQKQSRSFSSDHSFLIEEFIEGKEFSVESLTYKRNTTIIQITEKITTQYPYTIEIGHIQPAELAEIEKSSIINIVLKAIRALGIDNTATHTELKISAEGPIIIEVGARLGGDFISSYLTLASTGINMDKEAIKIALGNKPKIAHKHIRYSYIKYLEIHPGKVVNKVLPVDDLLNDPNVLYVKIFVKPGDIIQPITHNSSRPACIILKADSKKELLNKMCTLEKKILSKIIIN